MHDENSPIWQCILRCTVRLEANGAWSPPSPEHQVISRDPARVFYVRACLRALNLFLEHGSVVNSQQHYVAHVSIPLDADLGNNMV